MRLSISKSKNAMSLYVKKDVTIDGRRTSKIVEKLGTYDELKKKLNGEDPIKNTLRNSTRKKRRKIEKYSLNILPKK